MNKYTHYITTKYNDSFEKVDGLQWLPWVGKHYDETRILIIGASTHKEDKDDEYDWTLDPECNWGDPRNASLVLVAGVKNKDEPAFDSAFCNEKSIIPFDATVKMFLPEMDIEQARQQFWSAAAFNNFCQEIVEESRANCPCREESVQALQKTIEILKPRLVIAWTTEIWNFGFDADEDFDIIAGKKYKGRPRIAYPTDHRPAVAGILHPSYHINDGKEWSEFLQDKKHTKQPIADLMAYLKR